jgi:hypothetical protein
MTPPDENREMTSDGDRAPATLTDEQIDTHRTGAAAPVALEDPGDPGDDSAETGDDSGDTGDEAADTGDDSGDAADATDTGDDSGDGSA